MHRFFILLASASFCLGATGFFVKTTVDFGRDVGQSFGSIFEARDANGKLVAGAGFADVYNTRFRVGRRTLQFFVRPTARTDKHSLKQLPHPDLDCGVYLMELDERLYAWSSVRGNSVRRWDSGSRKWLSELPPQTPAMRSGDGAMSVGKGLLVFSGNRALFNGRQILAAPADGRYYNFYYAQGWLFFYHTHRRETGGFTRIVAIPWTTSDPKADLSKAVSMSAKYLGATPFAWGQWRGEVLTVSNQGGVHVFKNGKWRTVLEAEKGVSYQVYSMIQYHDRLLLAQYPKGMLFEYRGGKPKLLEGWPPRLPGVSANAREAQTMSIYRGELLVGVWPWAELWRHDRDADKWCSLGRMFTHPKLTDQKTHPYESEARRHKLVANHWGQRITGMVPMGNGLMLSTSSKGTGEWKDEYKFLTEAKRREYGAVIQLKMPGNLAAKIRWTGHPIELEFRVENNRMTILQDGRKLALTSAPQMTWERLSGLKVQWGQGVYGPLNGRLLKKQHAK